MIAPTVFAPVTATGVGEPGISPNFATVPALFGERAVQLPSEVHSPSPARPFHSVMIASESVSLSCVLIVSSAMV